MAQWSCEQFSPSRLDEALAVTEASDSCSGQAS